MGRQKIPNNEKNAICSISITPAQKTFVDENKTFDLSKFVQLSLSEYINTFYNFYSIELERGKKNE